MTDYPAIVDAVAISAASKGKIPPTDPRLAPLIAGATASIRRYCGWHITPEVTETVVLDTDGERKLPLPSLHIVSIAAIRVNGITVTGWRLSSEKPMVQFPHRLPGDSFAALEVDLTHGITAAPDVAQIITQVVLNACGSPLGATAEAANGVSITWAQTAPGVAGGMSLLQRDLDILDMYRVHGRP